MIPDGMFLKILTTLCGLAFLLLPALVILMAFISVYSNMLYMELQKVESEFFNAEKLCYMDKISSTQFAFNILFKYCREIKDERIRKRSIFLRKLSCVVIPGFIFVFVAICYGSYYFGGHQ